ncbi:MAG: ATP-binding protein [Epsilonproteobacteria bacterium]|nr:hypothetical protein [Campylobacterota bacterium]NPA57561.1 ATP-binding protein [Campylobacterota bacterium]
MGILELFYHSDRGDGRILPRKRALPPSPKLLVKGPRYCGKWALIRDSARNLLPPERTLFIDTRDLRFDRGEVESRLPQFVEKEGIELLCIRDYDGSWRVPEGVKVWATGERELEGFDTVSLSNLDFEEFLAFQRHSDPKVAFNLFLKGGNYPEIPLSGRGREEWEERNQQILHLTFCQELPLFREVAAFQGHSLSVHFIYKRVKEQFRIGKERLYTLFERWREGGYIHSIPKWGSQGAVRKLFFHNFLTKPLLHADREFPKIFENMVCLELPKEAIFYMEPLGFYLPEEERVVLPIPFGDEVRIQKRIDQLLQKNRIEPRRIEVVTVGRSFLYEVGGIECEILPFYRWAVGS